MKFEGKFDGHELHRRAARTDVVFDVLVRCAAGDLDAQIVNLSGSGFRLRSSEPLEVGAQVALEVAKLPPVKAVVRWTRGREAGGVFLDAVTL
jgi:hypothetical protein